MSQEFHRAYYDSLVWDDTYWKGVKVLKAPTDLWAYAELIHENRPQVIIETGTRYGGSALFMADLLREGELVVSIDLVGEHQPEHERVRYIVGDSADPSIAASLRVMLRSARVMVVLDSEHAKAHVLKELDLYAPLVTIGQHLVVEDTNINGHPVLPGWGAGPHEALEEWLPQHPEFERDSRPERFQLTFNPGGYLRRVA